MRIKNPEFSKQITRLVFWGGMVIIQECVLLIAYAIHKDFTATAAYLTATVGVANAMIMAVATKYLALAQSDHSGASDKQGDGLH